MIRLALLRHGHTAWNRAGRIQGRSDIPLDEEARAELADFALPAPWDSADLVSSPLLRASETAELVGKRAPSRIGALTEINWGRWEGKHGTDLLAQPDSGYRHIEEWGWSFRPPDGESVADLRDRLLPWVNSLERDTVAVCHIGVMRVLLALAHGWNFEGKAPFQVKRNRIYPLKIDTDGLSALGDPIRLIRLDR